jgi:hypothetical protein
MATPSKVRGVPGNGSSRTRFNALKGNSEVGEPDGCHWSVQWTTLTKIRVERQALVNVNGSLSIRLPSGQIRFYPPVVGDPRIRLNGKGAS